MFFIIKNRRKIVFFYFLFFLSSNLYAMDCSKRFYMEGYNVRMINELLEKINVEELINEINKSEGALLHLKGLMVNYGVYYDRNYMEALSIFDSLSSNDSLASLQSGLILLFCNKDITEKNKFHDLTFYFNLAYINGELSAGYFMFTLSYFSGKINLEEYIDNLSRLKLFYKYPMIDFELVYQRHVLNEYVEYNVELYDFFSTCSFFDILTSPNLYSDLEGEKRLLFIKSINPIYYNRCSK